MSGKSFVIAVGVTVVVVGGGYVLFRGGQDDQPQASVSPERSPVLSVSPTPAASSTVSPSPTASNAAKGPVKTVAVSGGVFYFNPKEIRVNKGDTVKIVFTNAEGFHDWVIDEFNARTPQIKAGETSTIEFVADKTGTFQYYCSVGSHRAQGMWGNLIVQ